MNHRVNHCAQGWARPARGACIDVVAGPYDVVVIGSGMGGSTCAWALARRGARVLVLERGERLPREPANADPREVFLRRRYKPEETWLDGSPVPSRRGPLSGLGSRRGRPGIAPNGSGPPPRPFAPGVHYVVGGNTKVYGASLPRFRERDFEAVEHADGLSPAWPFGYQDLEQYYVEAEALYRVHGTTGEDPTEPWRSAPYPYPAMPHEPYIAELADRLRSRGVHPASNAMGVDRREGGGCIRCRTCDGFPCPYGAKSDAETCALDPAIATGRVDLMTGARVRRLVASGRRVDHLVVSTGEGTRTIRGERFVLAAGAVNSAALLLASDDDRHPAGLGNRTGLVGRNFMMHNNAHVAAVDVDRTNDVVFAKTLSVNDWYHELGTLQLIGKVQGVMMKSWATTVPLRLLDLLARRSVEWLVMTEDLPHRDNRVVRAADGSIMTMRTALNTGTHRRLHRRAVELLRQCGYDAVFTQWFDISMNSHQCGTVVAGVDPATSVLDPWCRMHEVDNLWVVDGSFFPSSAAMNPALTIAAQALRVVAESELGG